MNDPLDMSAIQQRLASAGLALGQPLTYVAETSSTNDEANAVAKAGAPHGALVITDHQKSGRGRVGRTWFSPPNANLTFSLVLRPDIPVDRLSAITLAIGLAVADAVARFVDSAAVSIKWPNDVLVRSRKVAGILVETSLSGDRCDHVVAGIGVNVLQKEFDPSIEGIATSIAREAEAPVRREDVLMEVLSCLARRLDQFDRGGLSEMMADLTARDGTKGRTVRVGDVEGVADGIEANGKLRVMLDGALQKVQAGDVKVVK
jgi:BirA family biotin operon repressor/biotin-[acetyl-CoA-carboxylase] ligase